MPCGQRLGGLARVEAASSRLRRAASSRLPDARKTPWPSAWKDASTGMPAASSRQSAKSLRVPPTDRIIGSTNPAQPRKECGAAAHRMRSAAMNDHSGGTTLIGDDANSRRNAESITKMEFRQFLRVIHFRSTHPPAMSEKMRAQKVARHSNVEPAGCSTLETRHWNVELLRRAPGWCAGLVDRCVECADRCDGSGE